MGFLSDTRTLKRFVTGDLKRDMEIIVAPAFVMLDFRGGSIAKLRGAVEARYWWETQLDATYVRSVHNAWNKEEKGHLFLYLSNMAVKAVALGEWEELGELAARLDHNHWLVHEMSAAA